MEAAGGIGFGLATSRHMFALWPSSLQRERASVHDRDPPGGCFKGCGRVVVSQRRRIIFDARMWKHAGIGRYISELSPALAAEPSKFDLVFLSDQAFQKKIFDEGDGWPPHVFFKQATSGIYGFLEQAEILAKSLDGDLLHVPHFNVPVLTPKKLVVTVHDLIYLRQPESIRSGLGRAYALWMFEMLRRKASAIIAVSQNTKEDLLQRFPAISSEKIFVIPEAAGDRFKKIVDPVLLSGVRQKYSLREPYVLFVGSLKPHKNLARLIEAMSSVRQEQKIPHELVVVGRADPKYPTMDTLIRRSPFVKYLGELPDPEVAALYSMADLFVLPSLYEGFGLPVLEAMACGAPVLASNRTSLPEVVGDAGKTFDPVCVDALSELLYNILKNRDLREVMSKKGLERSRLFSWKKTASETLEVYRQVLG